jgi:hypothetical protein
MTDNRIKERDEVVHMRDDTKRGKVIGISRGLMVRVRTATGDHTLPMGYWQKVSDGGAAS